MNVTVDSLTVKLLESRYGITRSNVYNRVAGLKRKGYAMESEKLEDGRAVFNAEQIALMDALDAHIKAGGEIKSFSQAGELSYPTQDSPTWTQDTRSPETAAIAFGVAGVIDAIVGKLLDAYPQQHTDPLANLRTIQEACDRGWLLSTSQLAPLLGRKTLSGKAFERYGFKFVKAGKNGAEAAWQVIKE